MSKCPLHRPADQVVHAIKLVDTLDLVAISLKEIVRVLCCPADVSSAIHVNIFLECVSNLFGEKLLKR